MRSGATGETLLAPSDWVGLMRGNLWCSCSPRNYRFAPMRPLETGHPCSKLTFAKALYAVWLQRVIVQSAPIARVDFGNTGAKKLIGCTHVFLQRSPPSAVFPDRLSSVPLDARRRRNLPRPRRLRPMTSAD